jgi:hypothetical protein
VYIARCANVKQELDLKTKKWTLSKKQPCTLNCVYHAERPIFKKVENTIINTIRFKPFTIEDRLRSLFRFLHLTNRTTIIQEIDIIVQYNLKRVPRKKYYYPSIGHLRISHYESFKDYENRIFSEKIIDRSEPVIKPEIKIEIKTEPEIEPELELETDSDSEANSEPDSEAEADSEIEVEAETETEIAGSEHEGSEIFEQGETSDYEDPGDDYDYTDD